MTVVERACGLSGTPINPFVTFCVLVRMQGAWCLVPGAWCMVLGAGGVLLSAGVSVKVATIPGLKYTLKRTDSLRRAEDVAPYQVEADKVADGKEAGTVPIRLVPFWRRRDENGVHDL